MKDIARILSLLICLIVIIVGFTSAGDANNNVQEAIYNAIGCLGLIGMAIVITQLSESAAPKPAARAATKCEKAAAALARAEDEGAAAEDAFAVEAALARAEAEDAEGSGLTSPPRRRQGRGEKK